MDTKAENNMVCRLLDSTKRRLALWLFPREKQLVEARQEFEETRNSLHATIRKLRLLCDQDIREYHAEPAVFIRPTQRVVSIHKGVSHR